MKCVVCRTGETKPGVTTVTLDRAGTVLVFRKTPAQICANCGEAYLDSGTSKRIIEEAERAAATGIQIDVREFSLTST